MQNQPSQIAPDNERVIGTKPQKLGKKLQYAYTYRYCENRYYVFSITKFDSKNNEKPISSFLCEGLNYAMGMLAAQQIAKKLNNGDLLKIPARMSYNEAQKYL